MRRFFRWLAGITDADALSVERAAEIRREQQDLRDDVDHLARRFTKLQGQVTRAWRDEYEELDDEEDDDLPELPLRSAR